MRRRLVPGLLLLCVLAGAGVLYYRAHSNAAEIAAFERAAASNDISAQVAAYRTLLDRIGPAAQEVLVATLPPTPRSHAINHESGIYLYAKEGERGIFDCQNYLNGSCFHGFIESAIADQGFGVMQHLIDLCRDGRPEEQARECVHGVGHAILVSVGYEHLPDAIARCQSDFASSSVEIGDCDDGVFMENNFGEFSVPPPDRWYRASDPLYPCDDARIASDATAQRSCVSLQMQATLSSDMYPQFKGDIATIAAYCDTIGNAFRIDCEAGLSRQLQAKFGSSTAQIAASCAIAIPSDPTLCYRFAAESAYSFGAHDTALSLCEASGTHKDMCYASIDARISSTAYHSLADRLAACAAIREATYANACAVYARSHTP